MTRLAWLFVLVIAGAICPPLAAQQATPAFEVASIRPSVADPRADDASEIQPSGQFLVLNMTLDDLVRGVFEVQRHELVLGELGNGCSDEGIHSLALADSRTPRRGCDRPHRFI